MKASRKTLHILNQFVWPDWAPTGIYAEQLAAAMQIKGYQIRLVGGKGSYRSSSRKQPAVKPIILEHFSGQRGKLLHELLEYSSINRSFRRYIEKHVASGDIVIITSAPPLTINLHKALHKKGATSIYWLQDYYPELLRSVLPWAFIWNTPLKKYWNYHLHQWDHVVKIAPNLGYEGPHSRVIRNWATLTFETQVPSLPRTALYTGNLGYAHDAVAFVSLCETLKQKGYSVKFRGDGIGRSKLPAWIDSGPSFRTEEELVQACLSSEILIVAADPKISHALFPSKIWNFIASGRTIMASGFEGAMEEELSACQKTGPYDGLKNWCDWLEKSMEVPR